MTIFNAIGQVWTEIATWFIGAISNLTAVFYDSTTGLTFLGTTAVIALGIGIIFLIIGVIQSFLRMRS